MIEAKSKLALTLVCGALLALPYLPSWSQSHKHFPGASLDRGTLRVRERVEELYENREYERALLIYEEDLAPTGDKYAQYMVGYIHLAGQGVPPSRVVALAWYRLASERGEPLFVQARDELLQSMDAAEIEASNEIFRPIWNELGDSRLLLELIRADMEILSERTGSRLAAGADSRPLTVINVRSANIGSENFYQQVSDRVEQRLNYLDTEVEISDIALETDLDDLQSMEEDMRRRYAALRSP